MANMQKLCAKGKHYYDSSLPECPFCKAADVDDDEKICPKGHHYDGSLSECPFCQSRADAQDETRPPIFDNSNDYRDVNDKETEFFGQVKSGVMPVVGWLVCTSGVDIGKDFRLHAENNFVGRGSDQDIRLKDPKISREHFTVAYAPTNDIYFITMGHGKAIVYVNGLPLGSGAQTLKKGDKIKVANTTLIFVPFDDVKWEWD